MSIRMSEFSGRTIVVVGVITDRGLILLQLRPGDTTFPNTWECPGGKVESGETDIEALVRELHEELSLRVRGSARFLGSVVIDAPTTHIDCELRFYAVRTSGLPLPQDAVAAHWFTASDLVALERAGMLTLGNHT